jgi:hypothetical protein
VRSRLKQVFFVLTKRFLTFARNDRVDEKKPDDDLAIVIRLLVDVCSKD